ncbi:MAG TPA: hypothetical protein VGG85_18470 [Terracidiphilus sp.]
MKTGSSAVVVLLAMGACICPAQGQLVIFAEIEREAASRPTSWALPVDAASAGDSWAPAGFAAQVAGLSFKPSGASPKPMDAQYFLLNGAHLTMAVLDAGMTRHCIQAHRCVEGNPIMPTGFSAQLTIDLSLVSFGSVTSYRMKKQRFRAWWIAPAAGAVAHAAGAVSGLWRY